MTRRPVKLLQHIVAHGVNKRAEPFRLTDSPFGTHRLEHPQKRLLRNILDSLRAPQSRLQFNNQQLSEVSNEVLLRWEVPFPEPFQVGLIKGEKFHTRLE